MMNLLNFIILNLLYYIISRILFQIFYIYIYNSNLLFFSQKCVKICNINHIDIRIFLKYLCKILSRV